MSRKRILTIEQKRTIFKWILNNRNLWENIRFYDSQGMCLRIEKELGFGVSYTFVEEKVREARKAIQKPEVSQLEVEKDFAMLDLTNTVDRLFEAIERIEKLKVK